VIILEKGDAFTVNIDDAMATRGWQGGMAVQYKASPNDDLLVTYSDGVVAGFLLWGSNEIPDGYTAMTGNQVAYKFAVIGTGAWLIATTAFEQYTYASRHGLGPLVPIDYHASDRLIVSLRGLWTKEDEWQITLDPRRPNGYFSAFVAQRPTPTWNNYMTIQIAI
jgi:hypothetical protein